MSRLHAMAVLAALLLPACAGTGSRPAAPTPADAVYALPSGVDVTRLLAPPPQGEALARDLEGVHGAERARTPGQAERAEASATVDVFQFAEVLGAGFTAERVPVTAAFFSRMYRSALPFLQATKDCWNRPRPFEVDSSLAPLERSLASTRLRSAPAPVQEVRHPPADSPCAAPAAASRYAASYPSGHATVGAMHAILLAGMVPEQRQALFDRGWEHGQGRVVSGVHFPSDVEAGRILGTVLIALMEQDGRFRDDFMSARSELRAALGYP
jgi:acid phosphatase (class A)